MESLNLFPESSETHSNEQTEKFEEIDKRLSSVFEAYRNKIIDGRISGSDYSRMQQDVERQFPDISASVFNPYLLEHKKIRIDSKYVKDQRKKALHSTRLVSRHASAHSPVVASIDPSNLISNKNRAANDDTPDLIHN